MTPTGSSFAGVAIEQWEGQFNEADGGTSIHGVQLHHRHERLLPETVQFGATDISYATGQAYCTTPQVPYPFQYMPDVAGGLAFEYNLTGQNGQRITNLILNGATLLGIFTGAIKNWNNPQIAALNPGTPLPTEQITPYYRADPSGENYLLSDSFLHVDPGPVAAFQTLATVPPPPGRRQPPGPRSATACRRSWATCKV